MLDPRIYRTGLVVVALAVIVVAFSLGNQPGPLGTTLAPEAFNGQNAYATMAKLAARNPQRRPGSAGDDAVAGYVAAQLRADGFSVSTDRFSGRTVAGARPLAAVLGTLPGLSSESIVVVAHRDALQGPSAADVSGTAVLLELARDLSGQTQNRSIVLASTSGTIGGAGAAQLAHSLPGPVDAVITLGDMAGSRARQPVVVPWSNTRLVAPTMLRNTVAAALGSQATLPPGGTSLGGQFLHLALPMAISDQAPFIASGQPSVLLSLSGDRPPAPTAPTDPNRITMLGRTVLETVNALSAGPRVSPPSAYLLYAGKVVPAWGIRLLVLALIVPVLAATVDGLARARRRGHSIGRWLVWVLASAAPFALGAIVVLLLSLVGVIDNAVPGPVGAGAVSVHGSQIAIMVLLAAVIAAGFAALRGVLAQATADSGDPGRPGAAAALLLVLCLLTIAVWLANPFASALIVPALHLWMWVVAPEVAPRRAVSVLLVLGGLALPALAVFYYSHALALNLPDTLWSAVLLVAGGTASPEAAIECSVLLGCVISVVLIAWRSARQARPEELPITVRGPITYAGPGSLGGTGSALRR
jgi:Peptidase family M28